MPLEIRELHFKVTIDDERVSHASIDWVELEKRQQAHDKILLQACIERVLEILQEKNER